MNSRPKTLIILTPAFPADESDSAWVPPKQLFVKKLKENFPSLHIIVLSFNYPFHTTPYQWHGVEVIPFNGLYKKKISRRILWIKVWRKLVHLKKQQSLTGILSFWCNECALVGHYFAKWHHLQHQCWIAGIDAWKDNKLVKIIKPKPAELVAMSVFLEKEFYKNHGIKPAHLVPIGIDPTEFPQTTVKRDIDVLGVGSFNPFKQYDVFIHIIKELSRIFPGIKAVIVGGGSEKENLEKQIRELNLENNISLVGVKPHEEVLQWMQRTKVFIHPSAYEGFGAVCLEALYAGAEVISFCDPMQLNTPHWHIVKDQATMTKKALDLLSAPALDHQNILLYTMADSAKAMMKLFDAPPGKHTIEKNISYHNEVAQEYDAVMEKDQRNNSIRQKIQEKFRQVIPAGQVIDFGGGTGLDLQWLSSHNYSIIFCEPSTAMRQKAIELNNTVIKNTTIRFLEGNTTDFTTWHATLPVTQLVDGVLSNFGALNYIPDIRLLFQNLARIIKPGGHFVALVLEYGFQKRFKHHRRNALRSLLPGVPYTMYIPYKQHMQTIFIHSVKEIKQAAQPYFDFRSNEPLYINDFTIIHLVRNETVIS